MARINKNQSWNKNSKNKTKNQWIYELIPWEDEQESQIIGRIQINRIRIEQGNIKTETKEIQNIIRDNVTAWGDWYPE